MNAAHSKKCKSKRQITWCVLANVKRHTWSHVSPHRSKFMGVWTVATLVCVCYSTSPAWWVQRLSCSDWWAPHLVFAGWNLKRGPQHTSVLCVYIHNTFPLTTMLHVEKGRARFGFFFSFGSVAETRLSLLPQPTQQAALEDRATSPVSPDQENLEEGLNVWRKNSHANSPGLFIQATILDEPTSYQGRLVAQLGWKIHFTSRCQIIPIWVHINVSALPKSKLYHYSVNLSVFHPASINSQMRCFTYKWQTLEKQKQQYYV